MRAILVALTIIASVVAPGYASAAPIFSAVAGPSGGGDIGDCLSTFPGGTAGSPISASSACVGNGAGGATANASFGHAGAQANALDFSEGGYVMRGTASFTGNAIFTGVDLSAPVGFTHVSLNLNFAGLLNAAPGSTVGDVGFATVTGATSINGVAVAFLNDANRDGAFTCTSTFLGLTACGGSSVGGGIDTPDLLVPLNVLVPIVVSIQATASTEGPSASARSDFADSLDFPIGSDVFNLPDGVTANGPDLEIVDNRFVGDGTAGTPPTAVPEPPTMLLFFSAVIMILARRGWHRSPNQRRSCASP